MQNLDTDLLRTFLAVADSGSISAGAERIGRSQSAASLQVKRLETIIGKPVFERHGHGVTLSPAGERLDPVARQSVALLDTALDDIRADDLAGDVRLGIPDGHAHSVLADIVAEFSRRHPLVEIKVHCASGAGFTGAVADGTLDLALYDAETVRPDLDILFEEPTHWAVSRAIAVHQRDPLPVALFDQECWWRDAALNALHRMDRAYRIVYSSESVAGVTAAIEAGIAVGMLGRSSIGKTVRTLDPTDGFETMPASKLVLDRRRGGGMVVDAMADSIRRAFRGREDAGQV